MNNFEVLLTQIIRELEECKTYGQLANKIQDIKDEFNIVTDTFEEEEEDNNDNTNLELV